MTALRFQTGGRHQKSSASIRTHLQVPLTVSVWRFNTRKKMIKKRMDKNNRKVNRLYKSINTSAIWQHVLHIPPTKIHLTAPKNKTRATQKSILSEIGGLGEKKSGEWAKSSRKGSDRKSNRTRQKKQKRRYQKVGALRFQTLGRRHQKSPASLRGVWRVIAEESNQCSTYLNWI